MGRLYDVLDRAKTGLLRLEARVDALPSKTILLAAMRVREAQASSKIEDTIAPLKDIALAELDESQVDDQAIEVLRNRQAIEHGTESPLPVSIRLLSEMHRRLITAPSKRPGEFRDSQAYIGSESRGFERARFVPPPPAQVAECMKQWELFVNPGAVNAPPRPRLPHLVELALAHYQFETIHPFADGSGRLGRAIVNITPIKNGDLRYPVCNLSEWVHDHRQEYYDGLLRVSTHAEWEGWIRFFCTALAEQAELDLKRADRVAALYDSYQQLVTERRRSIMLTKLIDRLFENQVITIVAAKRVMGVSYTAAQRHVEFLVAKGVLKQAGKLSYGKIYFAPAILKAIRGQGED
ncbi:MAG: Fic family protein [Phycisphaerales bacterium]